MNLEPRRALDALIVVLAVALLLILALGGVDYSWGAVHIRLHDWLRPLALLVAVAGAKAALGLRAEPRSAKASALSTYISTHGLLALLLAAAAMYATYQVRVCGGLDSYGYQLMLLRAYQSWRLFGEHELELRGHFDAGRHLPLHEDLTLGGTSDLRGYDVDQFRGDVRAVFRAEYSIPLFKWRIFAFRALGFYDTGYVGFHSFRADRDYLLDQRTASYVRNDVGAGFRIYVNNIVLPLLGLDLGYGIEGHTPQIYFEVGLTDF